MGCTDFITRMHVGVGRRKTRFSNAQEVVVYLPHMSIPVEGDLSWNLSGIIGHELTSRIVSLRNQIMILAKQTGSSATYELQQALQGYMPLLIGLTAQENGFDDMVEFKWRILEDENMGLHVGNSWFELLSTLYMMAVATLIEANSFLIPKNPAGSIDVPKYGKKNAVGLFVKASGYLEFCIQGILANLSPGIKKNLPKNLRDCSLGAISFEALGMGTETQLSLAIESREATLPVKRRLACEQLSFFKKAYDCLSGNDAVKECEKHLLFIKWKLLEAKAAAYYYHGLFLGKGDNPCGSTACCCFLVAKESLSKSRKSYTSFCLATPPTIGPSSLRGGTAQLHDMILKTASTKLSEMHGWSYSGKNKYLDALPELPEFSLSLKPEDYKLPEIDNIWHKK